ncbi:DNA-directed DNA polymerase [Tanacetum coccineum]
MTRSTVKNLMEPLDKPEREFRRLRRAALRSHQNDSLAISGRNLFDDEASSSNNTEPNPKTLHEYSCPTSSGFQNPITGLRTEDPLCHVKHYLSIVDNIQADRATRDTSRLRFFHFSLKGKAAEWLDRIPTQIHINLPFLEVMIHMPKGAKFLKDLLSHKEKLEKAASLVKLSEECSAIIQRSLPQKEGDPGSFTLPWISKLKPTKMSIQLADRSIKYPIGVCKNLLVKVGKFIFPVDFVILEMDEDELVPIILGPPFLATARAVIDVHEGNHDDTINHDGKWTKEDEEEDSNKALAISFYQRT